jgi:hypothetical protein
VRAWCTSSKPARRSSAPTAETASAFATSNSRDDRRHARDEENVHAGGIFLLRLDRKGRRGGTVDTALSGRTRPIYPPSDNVRIHAIWL